MNPNPTSPQTTSEEQIKAQALPPAHAPCWRAAPSRAMALSISSNVNCVRERPADAFQLLSCVLGIPSFRLGFACFRSLLLTHGLGSSSHCESRSSNSLQVSLDHNIGKPRGELEAPFGPFAHATRVVPVHHQGRKLVHLYG